jgi:hypothetical protein
MSKRNHLPYVVECKPLGQAFYEPIAAFNVDRVAISYATDCYKGSVAQDAGYHYRVRDASKRRAAITLTYSSEHPVSRFTYRDVTKTNTRINVFLDDQLVGAIHALGELFYYLPKGQPVAKKGTLCNTVEGVKRSLETP